MRLQQVQNSTNVLDKERASSEESCHSTCGYRQVMTDIVCSVLMLTAKGCSKGAICSMARSCSRIVTGTLLAGAGSCAGLQVILPLLQP